MKLFGIISDHRALKSRSPALHNTVMKKIGLDGIYLPLNVAESRLEAALRGLQALGFTGVNVTVPYKEAVIPFLDHLSEEACRIGAVNTIVYGENLLAGHNTDAAGCLDALGQSGFDPSGRTALVLGNGGAARAVICALKQSGARDITVAGRRMARSVILADHFQVRAIDPAELGPHPFPAHLLVNATSASSPAEAPDLADWAKVINPVGCRLVLDLNYGRLDNFWQALAQRLGADFMDGLPMLALQARRSFQLWTGLELEPQLYLQTLEAGS
jgi:shikimate dehydrogenase